MKRLIPLFLLTVAFGFNAKAQYEDTLVNGDFEQGKTNWLGFAASIASQDTMVFEGDSALAWDLAGNTVRYNVHADIQANFVYTMTFQAKSSTGTVDLAVSAARSYTPFNNYNTSGVTYDITPTTSWATYSYTFESAVDVIDSIFLFKCRHMSGTGIVYFDDFVLTSVDNNIADTVCNGDFEQGTSGWNGITGDLSVQSTEAYDGTQALEANLASAPANPWDVQATGCSAGATSGVTYVVSFWAKGAAGGETVRGQSKVGSVGSTTTTNDFTLTTSWAEYTWEVTPSATTADDFVFARFQFPNGGNMFIDGVTVTEAVPEPEVCNGDFESGTVDWNGLGGDFTIQSTEVAEGASALEANITVAPANPWDKQITACATAADGGVTYQVTFLAKTASGTVDINGQSKLASVGSTIESTVFSITDTWTEYSWTVTPSASTTNDFVFARFQFPNVGTVYLDSVVVSEYNPSTGIDNELSESISVYPNPTSGDVNISLPAGSGYNVSIVSSNGEVVIADNDVTSGDYSVSLEGLPSGVYTVVVSSATGYATKRVVKI